MADLGVIDICCGFGGPSLSPLIERRMACQSDLVSFESFQTATKDGQGESLGMESTDLHGSSARLAGSASGR